MNRKIRYRLILIFTLAAMFITLSAVCVLAESSVKITSPPDGSTVKPGEVEVWTRFAQPPGMGDLAIVEGDTAYTESKYGVDYSPVTYRVYKDGAFWTEKDVNQSRLNFTSEGSKSTYFVFEDEGSYTIQASVPQTPGEYSSITIKVEGEFDGLDYSHATVDSSGSAVLSEGKAARCTLTPANNFMTAFRLTPSESGIYHVFSAGATKQIRGTLYEGTGNTGDLSSVDHESDEDGKFVLSAELTAGNTYTLLVEGYVKKTDTVFDVGFIRKSDAMMQTATEVTFVDTHHDYNVLVGSGSKISDNAEWYSSDESVVWMPGCGSSSRGTETYEYYYNTRHATLRAVNNGTATVTFEDRTTNPAKVYAKCQVTCTGIDPCSDGHYLKKTDAKAATETAEGNIEYWTCKYCGKIFKDAEGKTELRQADTVIPKLTKQASKTDTNTGTNTDTNQPVDSAAADKAKQKGADGTAFGKGASVEAAEAAIAAMTSDSDLPGSVFSKLQLKSSKQTKTSVTLSWKKVSGAKKYVIYGNKCGKANKMKRLGTSTGKTRTFKKVLGKKVRKGTYYKFMVIAYDKNGKVVSASKIIHVATKGGKVGNIGKITTRAKKNKVSVRKGKTFKLGAKQIAASKKLTVKKHRTLKYESSNKKIATVSSKGVIKGKKKGTCYVYVYAQNGVFARIKVTVK